MCKSIFVEVIKTSRYASPSTTNSCQLEQCDRSISNRTIQRERKDCGMVRRGMGLEGGKQTELDEEEVEVVLNWLGKGRAGLTLFDLLCCAVNEDVEGPDDTCDGNDVKSDRAHDLPPLAGSHLKLLPLQTQIIQNIQ